MDLRDYLRVLRKRWRIIAVCVLVALGAVAAAVWQATPKYEATAQLFVAAKDTGGVASGLQSSDQFSQDRVKSYANIINSPTVTAPVAAALGNGLTATQISSEIRADAPLNTVLINVHVTDASPRRAQVLANAVSAQFASYAAKLETTPGATVSPVKVTVVKAARLPAAPISPKKELDLILGLLVGLALGVGGAVLRETLDTTLRDATEISNLFGLPTLGAIAWDPEAPKRPLVVQSDPHSPRAEAFRQLRTNLQFIDIDHAPRSIVVSSSVPEEGKTTTATNLAITISQSGSRVLIVEGDLRRPRLSQYLGLEGGVGLTNVLAGTRTLDETIQPWGDGQLHVLASGPTPPNPSELLGSQGMADLIQKVESAYDLVLIDAPPLLPVTDAAILSNAAGGVILVVRHGHTKHKQLMHAVSALRAVDAKLYGIVLTMVPTKGPDSYYYGYNYRYDSSRRPAQAAGEVQPLTPRRVTAAQPGKRAAPAGATRRLRSASAPAKPARTVQGTRTVLPPAADDDPVDYFRE